MSLLNYVPVVPTYPTCVRVLNYYVPTCLHALNYYLHSYPHFLHAYVLTCLYIFFLPSCLCALVFHVLACLKLVISVLCNKASHQLNAIGSIQKYISFKEKEVFLIKFGYFKYYPFVWHFCTSKSLYKIEKYKNGHLDFVSDYAELLKNLRKATVEIKNLQCLALEVFKTVNEMKWNIFFFYVITTQT